MSGALDDASWGTLLERIDAGLVTPVLGAGASSGIVGGSAEIAREWATALGYVSADEPSLDAVAQYAATTSDRATPGEHIGRHMASRLDRFAVPDIEDPADPYRVLPRLDLTTWLTTNYDDLVERSLRAVNKRPRISVAAWTPPDLAWDRSRYDLDGFSPTVEEPLVCHLHGRYDDLPSMVVTENDYLEFLEQMILRADILPPLVEEALATTSLLFIGYGFGDVNLHLLLRSWRMQRAAFLVRPAPALDGDAVARFTDYYPRYLRSVLGADVRVFWGTGSEFCEELRRRTADA